MQRLARPGDRDQLGAGGVEQAEADPRHPERGRRVLPDHGVGALQRARHRHDDRRGPGRLQAERRVVAAAGDEDKVAGIKAEVKELAQKYFGEIEAGPPVVQPKAFVPTHQHDRYEVMYDRVPQARVYHRWAVPGRTTREAALLQLAASVLGTGKNSRLYQELIYNNSLVVDLNVWNQRHELASIFNIDATLQPDASLEEVNAIINRELARFIAEGPTEEELQRAQTGINADTVRGLEQIGGFSGKAVTLAQGELYAGDPGFFKTRLEWMNEATPEDVRAAAERWLGPGRFQLEVLPFGEHSTTESTVDRSQGLPAVGGMPDLEFPAVQRAELDNGLKVVLARRDAIPVVEFNLQFDAGHASDAFGKLGTAGFALAMMDEGTKNRSALEIAAEAEALGAEISTGSNLDMSNVSLSALKVNLEPSLDLWADVVREPAFAEDEIERLRKRWIGNIQQEKNQPVQLALRNLPPLIYGEDHAYGIPFTGSGTEESIASLTRALRRIPAVSISMYLRSSRSNDTSTVSRVVPGWS